MFNEILLELVNIDKDKISNNEDKSKSNIVNCPKAYRKFFFETSSLSWKYVIFFSSLFVELTPREMVPACNDARD